METRRTMAIAATVVAVLALLGAGVMIGRHFGSGAAASTTAGMNKEASARAVAFYRAFILEQDMSAAWDMSTPGALERPSKAEFLQYWSGRTKPQPDGSYQIKEFPRSGDYLYLVSDSKGQYLVWVTNQADGWKVKRYDFYQGGEIPW